jgi:hypothetical protein
VPVNSNPSRMAPSQLKRLKSSLRESGVVGPQKSKKQKKQASKGGLLKGKRVQRDAALQGIREQFNPFEVKVAPRKTKYEFANGGVKASNGVLGRPGVTKGLGEETVRVSTMDHGFLGLHALRRGGTRYWSKCSDERKWAVFWTGGLARMILR